jgi:stearoyl-CoA desaturase (Delta-9 desaturase)
LLVTSLTFGEGWHNFHHTFPWDYSASELGYHKKTLTTLFIDFFAWIGWAYGLKTASVESVERQSRKLGDGTKFSALAEEKYLNQQ